MSHTARPEHFIPKTQDHHLLYPPETTSPSRVHAVGRSRCGFSVATTRNVKFALGCSVLGKPSRAYLGSNENDVSEVPSWGSLERSRTHRDLDREHPCLNEESE